jgi:hypothetical protein
MSKLLRLLAAAAALNMLAAAGAAAQTVIVRGASPGQSVEAAVNGGTAVPGTVADDGMARVVVSIPANEAGRLEMDARLYVDVCDQLYRIHIVDRNRLPPLAASGCARNEVTGIYWVRQRSTIVVNVSRPIPSVLLRQGSYNPNAPVRRLAPKGLVVFAGGGLANLTDHGAIACGDVGECSDDGHVGAYSVGATLWLFRWLGVEGSYLRPTRTRAEGGGTNFDFTSDFDADIINVQLKAGIPAGPVRIYGQGGGSYHEGRTTVNQTLGSDSQKIETHTEGWSYTFGGGLEGWISNRFALYGEANFTKIKGNDRRTGAIEIEDGVYSYFFGLRFRIF